jgi:hypothetical protein
MLCITYADLSTLPYSEFDVFCTPQFFWYSIRTTTELAKLMSRFAEQIQIDPKYIYFYYSGLQVNPRSTAYEVSIKRTIFLYV